MMFHFRRESEPVRQGLNLYPLNDPMHAGGYLQIGRFRLYLRWSKPHRRLHWSVGFVPSGSQSVTLAQRGSA
jgi:hypothetical protein